MEGTPPPTTEAPGQVPVMKAADLGARFWLYEQEAGTAKCYPQHTAQVLLGGRGVMPLGSCTLIWPQGVLSQCIFVESLLGRVMPGGPSAQHCPL